MKNPSEKPCDICGDIGIAEVIATCSKCNNSREHIYCMQTNLCDLPVSWFCQPCLHHSKATEKIEVLGMGSPKGSDATKTVGLPSCQPEKGMLDNEGDTCSLAPGTEEKPVDTKVVLSQDHGTPNSESSYKFGEENIPNPPAINALWRGSLKILGSDNDEIYDGFQAYPPAKVLREAYLVSKEMPQVLHFTPQPRADVWREIFHADSPSGLDIALYFWVDDLRRESYNSLLELMEKQDLSLVSRLDNKELLIFTSRELPVESQKMNRKFYLWGVFNSLERRHSSVELKGKQTVVNLPLLSCGISNGSACLDDEVDDQMVDMEIKKDWNTDTCLTSNSPAAFRETSNIPCQDASDKGIEEVAKQLQVTKREKDADHGAPPGFSRPVVLKEQPSVEMRGKPHSTDVSAVNCRAYKDLANRNKNVRVEDMGIKKARSKEVGSVDICLSRTSLAACQVTSDVPSLDASNQGNEKIAKRIKAIKREKANECGAPPGFSRPILSKERNDSVEMQEKQHPAVDLGACEDSVDLDENILHREDMVIEKVGSKEVEGVDYGAPADFSRPILSKERHESVEMQEKQLPAVDIGACEDSVDLDENIFHREDMVIEKVGSKEVGVDYGAPPGFSRPILSKERNDSVEMQEKQHPVVDSGASEDSVDLDENILHREDMVLEKVGSKEVGGVDNGAPADFSRPILSKERHESVEMQEKQLPAVDIRACEDSVDLDENIFHREDMVIEKVGSKEVGVVDYGAPPGFSRPILSKERHDSVEMQEKQHPVVDSGACEDSVDLDENILHREDMVLEKVGSKEVGGVDNGAPADFSRPILSKERHESVEMQEKQHPVVDSGACEDSVDLDENILHGEDMVLEKLGSKEVGGVDNGSPADFSRPIFSKERHESVEMQEKQHPAVDFGACGDSVDLDENIFHREDMVIEKVGSKEVGGVDYGAPPGFSRPILSEERCNSFEIKENEHSDNNQTVNSETCEDIVNLDENILQVEDMRVEEIRRKEVGDNDFDGATGLSRPILSKEQCASASASAEMKEKQHPSDIKSVNCRAYENSVNLDENIHHIEDVGILEIGSKEVGGPDICLRSDSKAACWDNLDSSQDEVAKILSNQPREEKHTEIEECDIAVAPPAFPQTINLEEQQSSYDLKGKHVDPSLPNSRIAEVSVSFNKEVSDSGVDMEIQMAGGIECCGIVDIHLKRNVDECPNTMHILPDKVFPIVDSNQPIKSSGHCDYFNAPPGFSKPAHVDGQSVVDMPLIIYTTGEEPMTVAEIVDDYVIDMEIDMVGGEEVGILDVRDTAQGVIATVDSDQLTNTVASQSHQTRIEQYDVGASGVSKLAINVLTEKPIATSPMQISSVGHKLDAPTTFSNSIKMAEGTSSIEEQDHQIASNVEAFILGAQPAIGCLKVLKEQEEEDELTCTVCKKGYDTKPNDMLGVYAYSKQVELGTSTKTRCIYTTTSNFNIIHFQCHRASKRADAYLKNPMKEWQGAKLRNDGALCNSIFPIKSPSVSTLQYVRCVSEYWGNLNKLGCADGSRLQLLSYDLLLMLGRFSTRESFKCGEIEKSTRFLPFMIQMGRYLVEQESSTQRQSKSNAISSCPRPCSSQPKQLQLMMVNSLLSESYESWLTHRPAFLECGIELAYMQHKSNQPLFSEQVGSSENFCAKPILVYVGLIEQLQRFFKVDTTNRKLGWEVIMSEKLDNVKELLGFSKKLLAWLDEMMLAKKLPRVFEIMNVSSNMDFERFLKCEDFVRDVIPSIKMDRKRKRRGKKGT